MKRRHDTFNSPVNVLLLHLCGLRLSLSGSPRVLNLKSHRIYSVDELLWLSRIKSTSLRTLVVISCSEMPDKHSPGLNHFINTPLWGWHHSKQSDLIGWWGDKESIYKSPQCCFLSLWGVCWQLGSHTQLRTLWEARTANLTVTEERSKVRGRCLTFSHSKHPHSIRFHALMFNPDLGNSSRQNNFTPRSI